MRKFIFILAALSVSGCGAADMCEFGRNAEENLACRQGVSEQEEEFKKNPYFQKSAKKCPPANSPGFCASSDCCPFPPN